MFKPAPFLTLLFSASLLAPFSASASGACVNPDMKPLKVSAVKTPAAKAAEALNLKPLVIQIRRLRR